MMSGFYEKCRFSPFQNRAGRAKICRFTAPPPDRISYLIAPRAVQLPEEAALFLEDLRWELQQHPDVVIYF